MASNESDVDLSQTSSLRSAFEITSLAQWGSSVSGDERDSDKGDYMIPVHLVMQLDFCQLSHHIIYRTCRHEVSVR